MVKYHFHSLHHQQDRNITAQPHHVSSLSATKIRNKKPMTATHPEMDCKSLHSATTKKNESLVIEQSFASKTIYIWSWNVQPCHMVAITCDQSIREDGYPHTAPTNLSWWEGLVVNKIFTRLGQVILSWQLTADTTPRHALSTTLICV